MLHEEQEFSDNFIHHVLARSIRVEEDLIDQLFNSSEKRLARTLLLLARYGRDDSPAGVLPRLSQETLAEMIGSTRSRVNFFMNKFRKLGFIDYNGAPESQQLAAEHRPSRLTASHQAERSTPGLRESPRFQQRTRAARSRRFRRAPRRSVRTVRIRSPCSA